MSEDRRLQFGPRCRLLLIVAHSAYEDLITSSLTPHSHKVRCLYYSSDALLTFHIVGRDVIYSKPQDERLWSMQLVMYWTWIGLIGIWSKFKSVSKLSRYSTQFPSVCPLEYWHQLTFRFTLDTPTAQGHQSYSENNSTQKHDIRASK